MGKQTFTAGQVLTAAEMNSLQENDYNWTVTTKTASYTLAAGDEGTRIVMNNAGATTITVDDAVFSAGDVVWLHNIGAGTCTVTAGTATVNTAASLDLAQWEGGSLYFTSASSAIFFPTEQGGGGKILQVVSTTKIDTFSTTSTSYVDVTGLSVTITPSSTASKVLIFASVSMNPDIAARTSFEISRGGTSVGGGTAAGSRPSGFASFYTRDLYGVGRVGGEYLDSPASVSSLTYQVKVFVTSGTLRINTTGDDGDNTGNARTSSSITVMEVSA